MVRAHIILACLVIFGAGCLGEDIFGGGGTEEQCLASDGKFVCQATGQCMRVIGDECMSGIESDDEDILRAQKTAASYLIQTNAFKEDEGTELVITKMMKAGCTGCYTVFMRYTMKDRIGLVTLEAKVQITLADWDVISFKHTGRELVIMRRSECIKQQGRPVNTMGGARCKQNERVSGEIDGLKYPHVCCVVTIPRHKKYVVKKLPACDGLIYSCEEGEEKFTDDIGCGCLEKPKGWMEEIDSVFCNKYDKKVETCPDFAMAVCGRFNEISNDCENSSCMLDYQNPCKACQDERVRHWTEGECPRPMNESGPGQQKLNISSFESCVFHGFAVSGMYPRKCTTDEGIVFDEPTCEGTGGKVITGGSIKGIVKICMWTDIESYCMIDEMEDGICRKSFRYYKCDKIGSYDEGFYDRDRGQHLFWAKCATAQGDDIILGGQRDEHGCITTAGYIWCEEKEKCLRIWEEVC